jgi:beta-phosphoglucomutase-like phosphatase (HAD superfamily)
MRPVPPELVIFDCDGVLVDTEPISNRVMAETISDAGLPMTTEEVTTVFELPADWVAAFEERRAVEFRKGVQAIPGVTEALASIDAAGVPACVASQASREKMELTLGLSSLIERFEDDSRWRATPPAA